MSPALLQWAGSEIHVGPTACFGGGCSRILVGCVFWSEIATIYRHRRVDWVCKALLARWISSSAMECPSAGLSLACDHLGLLMLC